MEKVEKLSIFISWSKKLAEEIAIELSHVLDEIFIDKKEEVDFFLSSSPANGIEAGKNFHVALNDKLLESNFGILILTKYNQKSEWLMFEAGALSKNKNSNVIPFLFNREKNRREDPIKALQYYRFSENDFNELSKTIQRTLLKRSSPNLTQKELNSLVQTRGNTANKYWRDFNKKINTIMDNYIEEADDLDTMDLIMDESAYDYVVSKREEHLKELVTNLDSDKTTKRIIIFGGIATFFTLDSTTNAFARWLAKDHNPKLYICHENLNALLDRTQHLNEEIIPTDKDRAHKATEKIKKIDKMKEDLLNKIGNSYKNNIVFVELETMPSNFIAVNDTTIYLTPALDKRSSDTFTFKLSENSKLNYQLLDYMVSKIKENKHKNNSFLYEIDIIKKEIGEKNGK